MAVGVCDSEKSPFCIGGPYGYPNDTGEAVRVEPNPDRVAGDGVREFFGLIGFPPRCISSISGEFSSGVEALDDNDGVAAFSGSSTGPCSSPIRSPVVPLADGGADLVDPNCKVNISKHVPLSSWPIEDVRSSTCREVHGTTMIATRACPPSKPAESAWSDSTCSSR